MILALLTACSGPESVALLGWVTDAPEGGDVVAGASIAVLDDAGQPFSTGESLDDGSFAVDVPAGEDFFLQTGGGGYVTTGWSGTAGLSDFYAGDGVPWVAQQDWVDSIYELNSACPSAYTTSGTGTTGTDTGTDTAEPEPTPGGIVTGEVRQYLDGLSYGDLPLLTSARVVVTDRDGVEHTACYLDDDGESDPEATVTGTTGKFAVFGIPENVLVVDVFVDGSGTSAPLATYKYAMPDGGVVAMFPALVEGG